MFILWFTSYLVSHLMCSKKRIRTKKKMYHFNKNIYVKAYTHIYMASWSQARIWRKRNLNFISFFLKCLLKEICNSTKYLYVKEWNFRSLKLIKKRSICSDYRFRHDSFLVDTSSSHENDKARCIRVIKLHDRIDMISLLLLLSSHWLFLVLRWFFSLFRLSNLLLFIKVTTQKHTNTRWLEKSLNKDFMKSETILFLRMIFLWAVSS